MTGISAFFIVYQLSVGMAFMFRQKLCVVAIGRAL